MTGGTLPLLLSSAPLLLQGTVVTGALACGSMALGLPLGLVLALWRLSRWRLLQRVAALYLSFIRATPLLVQLFLIYYGLPQLGLRLDPVPSALLGFALNVGAYTSEILRASIQAVDPGQTEAARALGLTRVQTLVRVVLPQAARTALAPLGNSFISLVKDTSLAAAIQVPELFQQAQLITARSFEVFTLYGSAALLYWLLSSGLERLQRRSEARLSRHLRAG